MYKQGLVYARGVGRELSSHSFVSGSARKVLRKVAWQFGLTTAVISTLACSSQRTISFGPYNGGHLVTVKFVSDASRICKYKMAIACVDPDGPTCTIITSSEDPKIIIHEMCHCMNRVLQLEPDVCHDDESAGQFKRDRRYDVR